MPRHSGNQPLGSQLGRSLTDIIADTVVKVRHRMGPMEAAHRLEANNAWMEDAEDRLQPFVAAIMKQFPDTTADGTPIEHPEVIRQLKDMAGKPANQTDFLIYLISAFGVLFALLGDLGQIAAAPFVQRAWEMEVDAKKEGFRSNLISPETAAALMSRGKIGGDEAYGEAKKAGYDGHHVDLFLKAAQGPPAMGPLQALWARGGMSETDLNKLMDDALIDPAYHERVKAAFYSTMGAGDVVQAAIKGVVDDGTARGMYEHAGGLGDQWDIVKGAAGNAIGNDQAARLYTHGLISHEDFAAVIRYSRINPRFEPMAELLRFHYLPPFQIMRALNAGQVSAADATRWLTEDGLPPDQVAALVSSANRDKAAPHHELAVSTVLDLYQGHELSAADATTMLGKLGYDASEAPFLLELRDARRVIAAQAEKLKSTRAMYLAGTITPATASADLDAMGIGHQARDAYLDGWHYEKAAEVKRLTMAQVGQALKHGFISVDDASTRWQHMGYPIADIGVLIQLYPPPTG